MPPSPISETIRKLRRILPAIALSRAGPLTPGPVPVLNTLVSRRSTAPPVPYERPPDSSPHPSRGGHLSHLCQVVPRVDRIRAQLEVRLEPLSLVSNSVRRLEI